MDHEDKKNKTYIDIAVAESTMDQKANKNLGITQEYNKDNRSRLWDSAEGKAAYKDKVFGDKQTYRDPVSGNILHKSQAAARNKYHMKNEAGENISKKWADHASETDHVNALKDLHDHHKHNGFLSDDDFKEIANSDVNYRILSKSDNASKGEKNDWEIILDKDNGYSMEARKQLAKEKVKADIALEGKFAARTVKNVGKEFTAGAKETLVDATIPLTIEAVDNLIKVAQGEQTMADAAGNMAKTTVGVAVAGGANKVLVTGLTNAMANSKNALLKNIASSNEVGKIVTVALVVKDSAIKYANGEIDGKQFISEVGEKGATMVAGMIGGQIGKEIGGFIGMAVGSIAGPLGTGVGFVAGQVIGQVLGTIITTVACSGVLAFKHSLIDNRVNKNKEYQTKMGKMNAIENQALEQIRAEREYLENYLENQNRIIQEKIEQGFGKMEVAGLNNCFALFCEGLDDVLVQFGSHAFFRNEADVEPYLFGNEVLDF